MEYFHCSFEEVKEFYPRIPQCRLTGEDSHTERICCSTSITGALRGVPSSSLVLQNAEKLGMNIVVYVYVLESENVYYPSEQEVPDVMNTKEVWILSKPNIKDSYMIQITDFTIKQTIYHLKYHKCQKESNFQTFANIFHVSCEKLKTLHLSFQQLIAGIDIQTLLEIKENKNGKSTSKYSSHCT